MREKREKSKRGMRREEKRRRRQHMAGARRRGWKEWGMYVHDEDGSRCGTSVVKQQQGTGTNDEHGEQSMGTETEEPI
jgi:hypothetical protein